MTCPNRHILDWPRDVVALADAIHPDSRRFMDLSRERPWLSRLTLRMMGLLARFAREKMIANAMAALPEPNRQIIAQPEFQQGFLMFHRFIATQG